MKIKENQKLLNTKTLTAGFLILALLVAGFFVWKLAGHKDSPSPSLPGNINYDPPTEEQVESGQRVKEESLNNTEDTNNPPISNSVGITVTAKGVSNETYQIRVLIDRISNTGSCTISLSGDGSNLDNFQTVNTQALPGGSTCQGFNIPLSTLSSGSHWKAIIQYSDNDASGSTTTEFDL